MNTTDRDKLEYDILEFLHIQSKHVNTGLILIEFKKKASENNIVGVIIHLKNEGYLDEYGMGFEITDAGKHKFETLKSEFEQSNHIKLLETQKLENDVSIGGFNKKTMRITFFISIIAIILSVVAIIVEIIKNC